MLLLDRLGCQKGRFLEPFWEGKSVQNGDLTKLDVKKVNFQKSVFSLGGSTILKDKHAWKSNKNGSTALLRGNFFALNFRSRILIDFGSVLVLFWLLKWSQVGSQKFTKIAKKCKKNAWSTAEMVQDAAQGRLGEAQGPFWEGLGVARGGLGRPRGAFRTHFGEQKSVPTANQQFGASKSNKEKLEQQKEIEKAKISYKPNWKNDQQTTAGFEWFNECPMHSPLSLSVHNTLG